MSKVHELTGEGFAYCDDDTANDARCIYLEVDEETRMDLFVQLYCEMMFAKLGLAHLHKMVKNSVFDKALDEILKAGYAGGAK